MPTHLTRRKLLALVAFAGLIDAPDSAVIGQTDTQSAMAAGHRLEFDVASIRQNKTGPGDAKGDMATLMAVTPASLKQLMKEYPFDPMTIVTLGPGEKTGEKTDEK